MKITIEQIIEIVTREVITELVKKGINIDGFIAKESKNENNKKPYEVDMSGFKTPVLTENSFETIETGISELILPAKTIITPGARAIIKKKKVEIIYKS